MTTIQVGCDLTYSVTKPTSFLFNIAAARTGYQIISQENLQLNPNIKYETSSLGTEDIQVYRLTIEPCDLQLQYRATVDLSPEIYDTSGIVEAGYSQLPNEVLPYLNPSRYCESDRFGDLAREITMDALPGYDQVSKITDWVRDFIDYLPGTSEFPLSAVEVHHLGHGVCRDLAQLAIALCRSISIPARLVVGYLHNLQPMDLHAWFEAYVGGRWYTFDATQDAPRGG